MKILRCRDLFVIKTFYKISRTLSYLAYGNCKILIRISQESP